MFKGVHIKTVLLSVVFKISAFAAWDVQCVLTFGPFSVDCYNTNCIVSAA
jgi:hypothetical protein